MQLLPTKARQLKQSMPNEKHSAMQAIWMRHLDRPS
jgi:hypothetical protein